MYSYSRLQRAYPKATNALTGATVMATGDTAVQFAIEGAREWDQKRTGVCASFSLIYASPLAMWFGYMDRCFPNQRSVLQFSSKVRVMCCSVDVFTGRCNSISSFAHTLPCTLQ